MGAGMTPERRKQVIESIKGFRVKAVFVETSVNPKLVREIANEAGVKVGGELYSDSMGLGRVCRRVIHWDDARETFW